MIMTGVIFYYLVGINVATFLIFGLDKWKAKHDQWRIPESTLMGLALIGGSVGAFVGMRTWRHKTQHAKFKYGIPAIILVQIFLAGYLA